MGVLSQDSRISPGLNLSPRNATPLLFILLRLVASEEFYIKALSPFLMNFQQNTIVSRRQTIWIMVKFDLRFWAESLHAPSRRNPLLFAMRCVILLSKEAEPVYAERGNCDFRLVRLSSQLCSTSRQYPSTSTCFSCSTPCVPTCSSSQPYHLGSFVK